MYSYAVRHWHKPALTNIENHAAFTPLTLATKLGRKQIFDEMLELMKVVSIVFIFIVFDFSHNFFTGILAIFGHDV